MEDEKLVIGLLGESRNDTSAIKNLLENYFNSFVNGKRVERIICKELLIEGNITGNRLDTKEFLQEAKSAYQIFKPDVVVFIRDLDQRGNNSKQKARRNEAEQRAFRQEKFEELKKALHAQAGHTDLSVLFLLIQYAIENLILADLERANKHWNTNLDLAGQEPIAIQFPVVWLKERYPKYDEGQCPELFQQLRADVIADRHADFGQFWSQFGQFMVTPPKAI